MHTSKTKLLVYKIYLDSQRFQLIENYRSILKSKIKK